MPMGALRNRAKNRRGNKKKWPMEFSCTPADLSQEQEPHSDTDEDELLDPETAREALKRLPWYIAERTEPGKVGNIRHGIVLRHQRGAGVTGSHQQIVAEIARYVLMYDRRLPTHRLARAEAVAAAVAGAFALPTSIVLPYALANVAGMSTLPPPSAISTVQEKLAAGERPHENEQWRVATPCISAELYETYLQTMDDEDVLDLAAGVGLFIASVDSPPVQKLRGYDLDSGHADAVPFVNATASDLARRATAPENLAVHRPQASARPASPRSARRTLARTGMAALRTHVPKQTPGRPSR